MDPCISREKEVLVKREEKNLVVLVRVARRLSDSLLSGGRDKSGKEPSRHPHPPTTWKALARREMGRKRRGGKSVEHPGGGRVEWPTATNCRQENPEGLYRVKRVGLLVGTGVDSVDTKRIGGENPCSSGSHRHKRTIILSPKGGRPSC